MEKINEQAVVLGQRKSLVGVIAQGAASTERADRPTIVILNAGIIHRVGPHRMHVTLARTLASLGYTVLRFDLSGIGDSEARPDGLTPFEASLADIKEVLDTLESTRGTRRVVLAGLCSGADHGVVYAGSDPRVVGLILLDPTIPRTLQHHLHHYGARLLRASTWRDLATGRHPIWKSLRAPRGRASREPLELQRSEAERPEVRSFLERAYRSSVAGGVELLAVFTGLEGRHNYREQLLHAFPSVPFGKQLRLEYFKDADHTFVSEAHRAGLIRLIVEWVESTTFPSRA